MCAFCKRVVCMRYDISVTSLQPLTVAVARLVLAIFARIVSASVMFPRGLFLSPTYPNSLFVERVVCLKITLIELAMKI